MLQWDKGWDIPDAIGKDPCSMLQEAIDRQKLHVRVTALTNDSVGTLMAKAYTSSQAGSPLIGAIFGTGTNAAYAEDMTRIRKLLQPNTGMNSQDSVMVINTEWGAWFDQAPSALPGCVYDSVLDQESSSPGKQLFEKRTSGLYLGELLRLAMLDLISSRQLQIPAKPGSMLKRPYSIDAALISMLATSFDDPKATKWQTVAEKISATLDVDEVNKNDVQALLLLGAAIMKRAAQLAGATMAAIVIQSGRLAPLVPMLKPIATSKWKRWCKWLRFGGAVCLFGRRQVDDDAATLDSDKTLDAAAGCIEIGIDGSLFEHYPRFEEEIRRALRALPGIGPEGEARVKIGLTKDGSSLGAALIAQSVP
ncbi:glucokinase [Cordyceps javanica]|uniref:Phosphotransferase n=1 Tax=Cordyceps javanica TaxID=43265 RepID=A0A545UVU5_9HYPO|nr:glucokinase [Cordyceps javanica]TQW02386.1 glucokinase [Cordyceps javanica]